MDKLKIVYKAILAGAFINIAATIYLLIPNKIIGSLFFTFGLFAVLVTKSNLYTGAAGYFPNKSLFDLLLIFIGNLIGCSLYSGLYSLTTNYKNIQPLAYEICESKFSAEPLGIFIMSIFCGSLMFIAVDTFNKNQNIIGSIVVILCVSGFILAGFEHSIANLSYIRLANYPITFNIIYKLLLMTIGNFIGAFMTRTLTE